MDADMRHLVVFRLPQEQWENGSLNSSTLDDWIHDNTLEGKACVCWGDTDFTYHYLVAGFTTTTDAVLLAEYLSSIPNVEIAFAPPGKEH